MTRHYAFPEFEKIVIARNNNVRWVFYPREDTHRIWDIETGEQLHECSTFPEAQRAYDDEAWWNTPVTFPVRESQP